jgi:sec-independent protein translocase protein TatC
MLNFAGVLPAKRVLKSWRWLVVFCLTFAAVATPTADPFTMLAVAIPFMLIVFTALLVMYVNDARRARKARREGFGPISDDEASTLPEQIVDPEDLLPSPLDDDIT